MRNRRCWICHNALEYVRLPSIKCAHTVKSYRDTDQSTFPYLEAYLSLSLSIPIQKLYTSLYAYIIVCIDHFFPPVWLSLLRTTSDDRLSTSKDMIRETHHIYTFLRILSIRIYLASSYIISINQTCHGLHVAAYNLFSYICLYI